MVVEKKNFCTLKRYRGLVSIPSQSRYGDLTRVKGGWGWGQGSGPWLPFKNGLGKLLHSNHFLIAGYLLFIILFFNYQALFLIF